MTIAHDSEILGATNATAGAYTTAITPTNPPAGVCVVVVQIGVVTDLITSVTYGGFSLVRRRFDTEATEAGAVYIYWGAATFPSGAQNVVVNRTGTTSIRAAISTMTVAAGQTVAVDIDASGSSAGVANPSWTITTTATTTACYLGIHSGLTTMTNTPATNWTLAPTPGFEDFGAQGRGWARRLMTSAGSAAPGWIAATADDFVGSSIAFKEVPLAQQLSGPVWALQRSPRPMEQHTVVGNYAPVNPSMIIGG
jgi:hypothetical protein